MAFSFVDCVCANKVLQGCTLACDRLCKGTLFVSYRHNFLVVFSRLIDVNNRCNANVVVVDSEPQHTLQTDKKVAE